MALITTQSKPFMQLVDLQQKSLLTLNQIKDSVAQTANSSSSDLQAAQLDYLKQILDNRKDALNLQKKSYDNDIKNVSELSKSVKSWKTWGDKIRDITNTVKTGLDPNTISKKLFGAFNIGGVFNKKIAAADYISRRKSVGDNGPDLKERATAYGVHADKLSKASQKIDRMKAAGATDEDIDSGVLGRRAKRQAHGASAALSALNAGQMPDSSGKSASDAANTMGGNVAYKSTPLVQLPSDSGQTSESTTQVLRDQQVAHESQLESVKQLKLQTDLLAQIAANTSALGSGNHSAAGGKEDQGKAAGQQQGGSKMAAFGAGLASLGGGVGSALASVGQGVGAVFQGIMEGIAAGIKAFASIKVVAGVAVLAGLTAVIYGLGAAIDQFTNLDWTALAKAGVALGGLILIGIGAGAAVAQLLLGAAGLAAMAASVYILGAAMNAMGDGLQSFVDGLERLQKVDGGALSQVAAGMSDMGGAFVKFGAGQAAAGLSNLVTGFLSAVTPGGQTQIGRAHV